MFDAIFRHRNRTICLCFIFLFIIQVISCGKQPEKGQEPVKPAKETVQKSAVVATVGSRTIDKDQVTAELVRRAGGHMDKVNMKVVLDEMIQNEMLLAKALETGLDKHPEVIRAYNNLLIESLKQKEISSRISMDSIPDDEIKAYYTTNIARYSFPGSVRLAIIFKKIDQKMTDQQKAEIRKQLEEVKMKASEMTNVIGFGALAEQYSDDAQTIKMGGDIGWIIQDQGSNFDDKIVEAGFALQQPGEISEIISTDSGMFLIRLIEKRKSVSRPIEDVKRHIQYAIYTTKSAEAEKAFIDQLKANTPVQVFPDAFFDKAVSK